MMKSLLHILFGKAPDIFDESGEVRHKFPEEKWKDWDARFKNNLYDWRKHTGNSTKTGAKTGTKSRNERQ